MGFLRGTLTTRRERKNVLRSHPMLPYQNVRDLRLRSYRPRPSNFSAVTVFVDSFIIRKLDGEVPIAFRVNVVDSVRTAPISISNAESSHVRSTSLRKPRVLVSVLPAVNTNVSSTSPDQPSGRSPPCANPGGAVKVNNTITATDKTVARPLSFLNFIGL